VRDLPDKVTVSLTFPLRICNWVHRDTAIRRRRGRLRTSYSCCLLPESRAANRLLRPRPGSDRSGAAQSTGTFRVRYGSGRPTKSVQPPKNALLPSLSLQLFIVWVRIGRTSEGRLQRSGTLRIVQQCRTISLEHFRINLTIPLRT